MYLMQVSGSDKQKGEFGVDSDYLLRKKIVQSSSS